MVYDTIVIAGPTWAGFGGVILHGLSTYGFAGRAVLKSVGEVTPALSNALVYYSLRLSSLDKLETGVVSGRS